MCELSLLPSYTKESMKSVHQLFIGGAHCTENTLKRIRGALTNGQLYFSYGTSEVGRVSANYKDYKLKSVGRIVPNLQMKIVDTNTGEHLGPNEIGEVCFRRTGNEWLGYYKNPEANKTTIDSEGFTHTGDMAYVDDEQYLYLIDREQDFMKHLGYKWSPNEIEIIIAEMPDVIEACAFGVYDEIRMHVPAAAVVAKPGSSLTAHDVVKYVEQRSEVHFKHLNAGAFILDKLPRNRNGKILRDKVKDICLAEKNNTNNDHIDR